MCIILRMRIEDGLIWKKGDREFNRMSSARLRFGERASLKPLPDTNQIILELLPRVSMLLAGFAASHPTFHLARRILELGR